MPLRGDFVPNRHFLGCFDGSSCHTPRGQGLRFSTYRSLPSIRGRANVVPTMNRLFVRLTILAVEAPKVTQILLSDLSDRCPVTKLQITVSVFRLNYAFHLIAEGLMVCTISAEVFLYEFPFRLLSHIPYSRNFEVTNTVARCFSLFSIKR